MSGCNFLDGRWLKIVATMLVTAGAPAACGPKEESGDRNGGQLPLLSVAVVWIAAGELNYLERMEMPNDISLSRTATTLTVLDRGVDAASTLSAGGDACVLVTPRQVECSAAGVTKFRLDLRSGDDTAASYVDIPGAMYGGEGNDTLLGGLGPDLFDGGFGADVFEGNGGDDTVTYATRDAHIVASIGGGPDGEDLEQDVINVDIENLVGGNGDDTLYGDGGPNRLDGGGGVDELFGGMGGDSLYGGEARDYLNAGSDSDVDFLDGGSGSDYCLEVRAQDKPINCVIVPDITFRR